MKHQQEHLSVLTHQLFVEMQLSGGQITSPVTYTCMMDLCWLLVPNVLQITNTVPSPGTDGIMLALARTPPVWTSQTKSSPSTPPADSTPFRSYKLIKHSGARVTMIGTQVNTVIIWMIGLLKNKRMRRSEILMVVKEAVLLLDQTVLPASMKTFSTAPPQDSASTRRWFVMAILIQTVVAMMKICISVWTSTSRKGLSRDMPP